MLWLFAFLLFILFGFRIVRIRRKNHFIGEIKSSFQNGIVGIYRCKGERSDEQIKKLRLHFSRILWHFINQINQKKSIREILRMQIKVIDDEELVLLSN
jgi:predicted membrane metal-binding protein